MKLDDMLMGRRIRQNHALEHATFTILSQWNPHFSGSARSFSDGFIVFGNVDMGELRRASEEALRRLQAGEAVLINSVSSGVSMAAIQICKLAGAYVYTTSSADWKLQKAKELKADETINYNEVDFVDEIMKRTNKRGVDVVVEHVGGDFLDKSIRCLTRGGRLITVGGTKSYECTIAVNYIFHKELQIVGSNSATKHDLEVMMPLLAEGKLKTVIDRVFPLSEAAEAHRYLESAKQFGKVILRVQP